MIRHSQVRTNGISLHCAEAGSGPLILLLHGFPEFWYGWRRQIPDLAAAGFRVVAPDLRGYGLSDRPSGIESYRIQELAADVAGLVESLGEAEAVIVGHDWGGVVAWYTAMLHPGAVRRLVVLNAPHPVAYAREMRKLSSQVWRSWYAGFHQLPWLPEAAWRAGNFMVLRRVIGGSPAPAEAEMDEYVNAFARPGAITAALNYYRAALRHRAPRPVPIASPTLIVWGERDRFLVPELTLGLERWVPDLRIERLPRATHWVQHDEPATVGRLIADFARPLSQGEPAKG